MTLVEILVAILILGVGIVGLSNLYLATMWTYQKARNLSLATQRAELELENIQRQAATAYTALTDTSKPLIPACYSAVIYSALPSGRGVSFKVPGLPGGSGKITITTDPFKKNRPEDAKLASASIVITWTGSKRGQSNVSLTTLITNYTGG